MKLLITGCSGYVGASLALELIRQGYDVIGIDTVPPGPHLNGLTFIEHDIKHPLFENAALREVSAGVDLVFHVAALAYVGESFDRPADYAMTNIIGTQNVLEWMLREGIHHLVFTSSCSVLKGSTGRINEHSGFEPLSPYAISKLANENQIKLWSRVSGGTYAIARFFNVAGAYCGLIGDRHDPEPHLIPRVVTALKANQPVVVNGSDFPTPDGSAIRDYVHIEDLLTGLVSLMTHSLNGRCGEFNLGSGVGHSVLEVINEAARIMAVEPRIVLGPRRPGDAPELVADISLAQSVLAYNPVKSKLASIITQQIALH